MSHGIEHGGALDRAIALYGGEPSDWLDLSTGINPEIFPLPDMAPQVWNRLPDEKLLADTLTAARHYYGVADDAPMVAAPGTQALIQLLPQLSETGSVAIIGPTYQEHAASFAQSGWQVSTCSSIADIPDRVRVAVVVNPNNPDGRVIGQAELLQLAARLQARGGFLIVDEAFADPQPETSVAAHAGSSALVLLKSFGKYFGLAGVRLGFALAGKAMVDEMARRLGPWAVSAPALAIAQHAFTRHDLRSAFQHRLAKRRQDLGQALRQAGIQQLGGCDLFVLIEMPAAAKVYDGLCRQHILVRKFDYAPNWLRLGLPEDEQALARLTRALNLVTTLKN